MLKTDFVNPFASNTEAAIWYKKTTATTMEDARQLIKDQPATGTIVFASEQTAGKGRIEGRKWISAPDESLMFTILIREKDIKFPLQLFPLFAGYCLAGFLDYKFKIKSQIKWPNDVLINDKKISGILCENTSSYVLCGIGLNLNQRDPGAATNGRGVSVYSLTGKISTLQEVLIDFLGYIKNSWESQNWLEWVSNHLYKKDKEVILKEKIPGNEREIAGIIRGIGENGELILENIASGAIKNYYSGEISFN